MAQIDKLNAGNVFIYTGTQTSARKLLKKEKHDLQQISVTIDIGETTAFELQSQLSHIGVKNIDALALKKIAGKNKVFDAQELEKLDDYLEESMAIYELDRSGVDIDKSLIRAVSLEKAGSPDYIKTLKYLYKRKIFRRSRINVDGALVNALTL